MRTANGNTLIYSGRDDEHDDHKEGVALLLNKEGRRSLLEWKPVSEKIIIASLKTKFTPVTLVECYAATEMANNEEKGKFYGQIRTVLKSIKKQDDNAERFLELCGNFNMTIGATVFPHMICHKISWTSPDSRTQNQTDHIAISII
jgi:hypothetical protein